jgi:hypothetical protein
LSANIEFPEEAQTIGEDGANGVGLYRTEYLFLTRKELPSEEEQYREYARIVQIMGDQPIIIRTLDVGGDKLPTSIKIARKTIRFSVCADCGFISLCRCFQNPAASHFARQRQRSGETAFADDHHGFRDQVLQRDIG